MIERTPASDGCTPSRLSSSWMGTEPGVEVGAGDQAVAGGDPIDDGVQGLHVGVGWAFGGERHACQHGNSAGCLDTVNDGLHLLLKDLRCDLLPGVVCPVADGPDVEVGIQGEPVLNDRYSVAAVDATDATVDHGGEPAGSGLVDEVGERGLIWQGNV